MIKSILTEAGVPSRRSRHTTPPAGTYAAWMDDIETDGPDGMPPRIFTHGCTIELYEPHPDDAAEAAVEAAMSSRGLHWTKQDRYWLQSEKMYQVVYEFSYIEKRSE